MHHNRLVRLDVSDENRRFNNKVEGVQYSSCSTYCISASSITHTYMHTHRLQTLESNTLVLQLLIMKNIHLLITSQASHFRHVLVRKKMC